MATLLKQSTQSGLKKQRRTRLAAPMAAPPSAPLPKKMSVPSAASTATMLKFVALQQHQSQLLSWMNTADAVDYSFIR